MDWNEQKRIVRQQRAGFMLLRQREIERMRAATVAERLDAFTAIMELADQMGWTDDDRKDDAILQAAWQKVYARYDAANR